MTKTEQLHEIVDISDFSLDGEYPISHGAGTNDDFIVKVIRAYGFSENKMVNIRFDVNGGNGPRGIDYNTFDVPMLKRASQLFADLAKYLEKK